MTYNTNRKRTSKEKREIISGAFYLFILIVIIFIVGCIDGNTAMIEAKYL